MKQLTRQQIRRSIGAQCRALKKQGRDWDQRAQALVYGPVRLSSPSYRRMRLKEVNHYSQVQIVKVGERKYGLNYDRDNPENITGPFTSQKKAAAWFIGGGR